MILISRKDESTFPWIFVSKDVIEQKIKDLLPGDCVKPKMLSNDVVCTIEKIDIIMVFGSKKFKKDGPKNIKIEIWETEYVQFLVGRVGFNMDYEMIMPFNHKLKHQRTIEIQ